MLRSHGALGLCLALLSGLAAAGVAPPPAHAQDAAREPTEAELEEARHSFEVASAAFDQGDYETAAAEFRAAHELLGHPDLLFNVYLAEERAGRHAEAMAALEGYLAGATLAADQRAMLERRLARLRERVARMQAGAPEPTAAEADEGDAAHDAPIALAAPVARERGAAEPSPLVETGPPTAAIVTLVAAGVLALSFGGLAIASEVEDQSLASSCGRDAGRWCSAERVSTLEALNVAADASWIGAAALGALGVVLLFALPPERAPASARLVPWIGPAGAGLAAGARF